MRGSARVGLTAVVALLVGLGVFGGIGVADAATSDDDVNVVVQVGSATSSPPTISHISPISGPVSGGTEITIYGTDLDGVTEVDLGNGQKCEPIVLVDSTCIKCTTPPHLSGYVDITLVSPFGNSTPLSNAFRYLDNATPVIPPGEGGNGGVSPLVPETGLFRFNGMIVTNYELFSLAATIGAIIGAIVIVAIYRRKSKSSRPTT